MLYIEEKLTNGAIAESGWHIGEPMPYISPATRVMTFQADGDELIVILDALRQASAKTVILDVQSTKKESR